MKLFICDTYYQLIEAIQIKLTLFKNEKIDVRISDHSKGASDVAKRLAESSLFHEVFL